MNTLRNVMIMGVLVVWHMQLPAGAQLTLTLDAPNQAGQPGDQVLFSGILTNTGGLTVFLNGDDLSLNGGGLDTDDSPFLASSPASIDPGATWSGDLFYVTIDTSTIPDLYPGTFSVLGGDNPNTFDVLSSADFSVFVRQVPSSVPEIASSYVYLTGISALIGVVMTRAWRRYQLSVT